MWACSADLLEAFSFLSQPSARIINDPELSLNELKKEPFEVEVNKKINEITPKWIELDEKYVKSSKRKGEILGRQAGSQYLALPSGANIWKIEDPSSLTHPRVPEEKQKEYFEQLGALLKSIPRQQSGLTTLENLSLAQIKHLIESDSHTPPKLTGFYHAPDAKSESTTLSSQISSVKYQFTKAPNIAQETVFTISLHSCYDCHNQPDEIHQEEFQLLGSNTLKHLKGVLYCVNGLLEQPIVEDSTNIPLGHHTMSDVPFLESCFFIEGIFYIDEDELPDGYTISDLQNEIKEAAPPSVRIRGFEWLHKIHNLYFRNPSAFYGDSLGNRVSTAFHASSMESFMKSRYNFPPYETESLEEFTSPTVRSMNETTLSNLKIRLGLRYYYCHLRQICEHYLYFSDIRLFNTTTDYQVIPSTDPSSRRVQHLSLSDTYPRLTYMAKFTRKKCDVCLLWSAQYIVYGDRLTINNPTLFCQHCYHMLHYTHEGELLYDDYSVFPYLHDMK